MVSTSDSGFSRGFSRVDTLEGLVCLGCAVLVRMQPQRQLPVGLLDLVVVGALLYPEHVVMALGLRAQDLQPPEDSTLA